jgi:hypothetical protein
VADSQQPADPFASIAKPVQQGSADPFANMPDATAAPASPKWSMTNNPIMDLHAGLGKGVASTVANIDDLVARHVPGGHFLTTPLMGNKTSEQARQDLHNQATPQNFAQRAGKFAEQAGEFMLPGGLEESAAAKLAENAPKVAPLARTAVTALSSGAVNKAQGGGFGTGALVGGLGAGASEALNAAAPAVAEKALGIRGKFDRSFNKEPGKAALEETSGIRPETVARSAGERIGDLSGQVEDLAANSPNTVSLVPARQTVNDAMGQATRQNAATTHGQLAEMGNTLNKRFDTGALIPQDVPASEALDLRRGFNQEHMNWNPDRRDLALTTGRRAYGDITGGFHEAVPGSESLDQSISSLIPVKNRASIQALNEGVPAKMLGRVAAHTGAGAGGLAGAYEGRREGGVPGAIAGGLIGLAAPELIASPEGQMAAARMMHSATSLPLLRGAILNVPKQNGDQQ